MLLRCVRRFSGTVLRGMRLNSTIGQSHEMLLKFSKIILKFKKRIFEIILEKVQFWENLFALMGFGLRKKFYFRSLDHCSRVNLGGAILT